MAPEVAITSSKKKKGTVETFFYTRYDTSEVSLESAFSKPQFPAPAGETHDQVEISRALTLVMIHRRLPRGLHFPASPEQKGRAQRTTMTQ